MMGLFKETLIKHFFISHFKVTLENYLGQFRELTVEERRGWVAGLGHGVLPKTPEDNVKYYVDRTREFFSNNK